MAFMKKTVESSLGVDIGPGGIKILELRKSKGRPQLWTYAMVDQLLDVDIKESVVNMPVSQALSEPEKKKTAPVAEVRDPRVADYAKLLRMAVDQAHATAKHVTASLPVSQVFHAIVNLPMVEEKELDYHVQAKVKKMLSRPIEEMQVVHQVIPTSGKEKDKSIKTLVTAAPKSIVKFYTDIFQKAGLQLTELETEAFALERSLVGIDKATVMIVDIGAAQTNFFIVDQGFPVTHRSVQIGGNALDAILQQKMGLSDKEIATIKYDISRFGLDKIPADMFARIIDPIVKEIQYGFDLFLHQTGNEGKRPEKIILTGGASVFPPLIQGLRQNFSMKVFVGDPWARVVYQQGLKDVLDKLGPRMSVSIGLALRGLL